MTYPGGKGNLYQKIINLIPPHRVYVELFAGAAAVARNKRPAERNILVDLDRDVIEAAAAAIAGQDDEARPREPSPGMTSAAIIVQNGDGYRRASPDTVMAPDTSPPVTVLPAGPTDPAMLTNLARFVNIAGLDDGAAKWLFIWGDALDFLQACPLWGDAFVYCDPPYLMSSRRQQRQYYRCEFHTEAEHTKLLKRLLDVKCPVMISGYDSDLYRSMLAGWNVTSFETRTRGNSTAIEYLWMNYPRPVVLHDYDHLGDNFRERERIKRKKARWAAKWRRMPVLERQAILSAIAEADKEDCL